MFICLQMAVFLLQQQRWVAATEAVHFTKPKRLPNWPSTEKMFADSSLTWRQNLGSTLASTPIPNDYCVPFLPLPVDWGKWKAKTTQDIRKLVHYQIQKETNLGVGPH